MPIDPEGDLDAGVPESFAHGFGVEPRLEPEGRRGMPEIVEAHLREARALEGRVERAPEQVRGVLMGAAGRGKEQRPAIAACPQIADMRDEQMHHRRAEP